MLAVGLTGGEICRALGWAGPTNMSSPAGALAFAAVVGIVIAGIFGGLKVDAEVVVVPDLEELWTVVKEARRVCAGGGTG